MSKETSYTSQQTEEQPHAIAAEGSHLPVESTPTPTPLFYEDLNFRVRVTPQTAGRVLFEIECSLDQAKKLYTLALEAVRRHVVLPGFRKGKAPKEHVLNSYKASIEEEWKRLLREQALAFAISSSGYTPLVETHRLRADVELSEASAPPFIRCACDAMPPMPSIDLEALHAHLPARQAHEVTEEDENQALYRLRSFYASRKEVDRPAKLGDCLHIEALDPRQQEIFKERNWNAIELDPKATEAAWLEALVGAEVGNEKNCFPREEIDPSHSDPLYQDDATTIPIKITRIEEIELAPLDDALAQKAGCKSVAELLERVKLNLKQHALYNLVQQRTADLKTLLLANYPLVIPPVLLRNQYEMHRPLLEAASIPQDQIQQRHAFEQVRAREFLHLAHLLNKWVTEQKISIQKEDLEREYQHQLSQPDVSDRFIHDGMTPEMMSRQLLLLVVIRKGLHDILLRLYPDLGNVAF